MKTRIIFLILTIVIISASASTSEVTAVLNISSPEYIGITDGQTDKIWKTRNCCRFEEYIKGRYREPPLYCLDLEMMDRIENTKACEVLK